MSAPQFLLILLTLPLWMGSASHAETPDFENDVAPLLIRRCIECHAGKDPAGGLSLESRDGLLRGGDSGAVIDVSTPEESGLLTRVVDGEMPPEHKGQPQKLPDSEIKLLTRWVQSGANWPRKRRLDWFERTNDLRAGRDWWSLQPIRQPRVPASSVDRESISPIDAFVLAKLDALGMSPAPQADPATRLRRLHIDLVGLPPTQDEIEAFVADPSPESWERVIDQLLQSPQYGVRWARYWLDVARYADTSGYERDQEKPFAWKYRDWVVDAFNDDMPYDEFVVHQLAGDEIKASNEGSVIATGFLRLGTWNDEPNDPADYQYDRLEDLVHTTSSAFLGMTVKCARCHSHKFDAITQDDYYRMASAFWAGPIDRGGKTLGGVTAKELGYDQVLGWTDTGLAPRPLFVLKNGERKQPLHKVVPATLSMLPDLEKPYAPPPSESRTTTRRLQLANWIVDPKNPLSPRVLVNRIWQHHFGQAIVRTPNNFGFLSDPPTHPELLDWLAAEFVKGDWRIKRIHKLILMSETWQQSSVHPRHTDYQTIDAGNRLWWRANRRRLDAEALRDGMLLSSGELDTRIGGAGFRQTISKEALEGLSRKETAWNPSPDDQQRRRSLYLYAKRGLMPPMMTTFDMCDSNQSCGQRDATTVPTQALAMLNNPFVHDRSRHLAAAVAEHHELTTDRIVAIWSRVLRRSPSAEEIELATEHLADQKTQIETERTISTDIQSLGDSSATDEFAAELPEPVLRLRADQGVLLDESGKVRRWRDLSSGSHDAIQTTPINRPAIDPVAFSGRPAILFDAKQRFMMLEGSLLSDQPFTIIAVASDFATRRSTTGGHREIISNWNGSAGNSTTSLFLGLTGANNIRLSDARTIPDALEPGGIPFILSAGNGADHSTVRLNGRSLHRGASLPERRLTTSWVIGQQGNIDGEFWHGCIAELIVYPIDLTDAAIGKLETQLAQRYDITLAGDEGDLEPIDADVLALASLAHVLLNSNEFLYVD